MSKVRPPFLAGTWSDIVMVTWVVDPVRVKPFLPAGTELDLYKGDALLTLTAIDVQDARFKGFRVPWHRRFPVLSLQCCVRHKADDGTIRRGLSRIDTMVSRRLVAIGSRVFLGEQFRTRRMRRAAVPEVPPTTIDADARRSLVYEWQRDGEWERIIALTVGAPRPPRRDSVEAFVTDRPWRFTGGRSQPTAAYQITHEPWDISLLADCLIEVDLTTLFDPPFTAALSVAPVATLAANGSRVDVHHALPLTSL